MEQFVDDHLCFRFLLKEIVHDGWLEDLLEM